ncbi:MAG: hypothetical protein AB1505_10095 [Candidatus Latescibacterota bacterium]
MGDAAGSAERLIRVHRAAEGPLRQVDLDLPLNRLTCFTGPAGQGARTMAVDVLWAESRRRYMLALSPAERQVLGAVGRVAVEGITGLPPAIHLGAGAAVPRGSVAAFLQVEGPLAQLVRRAGEIRCPACGDVCLTYTEEAAAERAVAWAGGRLALVLAPLGVAAAASLDAVLQQVRQAGFLRVRLGGHLLHLDREPVPGAASTDVLEIVVDRLDPASASRPRLTEALRTARTIARGHCVLETVADGRRLPLNQQLTCQSCAAEYRAPGADDLLAGAAGPPVLLRGRTLAELLDMPLDQARAFLAELEQTDRLAGSVTRTLAAATDLGLGYLPLSRPLEQLATGERGRLLLAASQGSGLVGLLYVCDAPSRGLGPDQLRAVTAALRQLVVQGNTLVVLDHASEVLADADRVVEFDDGSTSSPVAPVPVPPPTQCRIPQPQAPAVRLCGQGPANLRPFDLVLPLERVVCCAGPSGAGKSAFLRALAEAVRSRGRAECRTEYRHHRGLHRVVEISAAEGESERALLEALGLVEPVARLYAEAAMARQRRYPVDWFRLDAPGGRCPTCEGRGVLHHDMQFLEDIRLTCPTCAGRRFRAEVLEVTVRGLSLGDVLEMGVDRAALHHARDPRLGPRLEAAQRCGLGRHALGTRLGRLEHGERIRLQLALELPRLSSGDLLLLDLPLAGEHPRDAAMLLAALQEAVSRRASVVVADNHPLLLAAAACCVDVGPGSGPDGGQVRLRPPG